MNKRVVLWTLSGVLSIMLAFAGAAIAAPQSQPQTQSVSKPNEAVQQAAQRWFDELKQQPPFAHWKDAQLKLSPLGPGTHSWLVLVINNNDTAGYMIIHAKEDGGYQLGEYGNGDYVVFGDNVLQRSIAMLELSASPDSIEPLYIHPLLAMWKITASKEHLYTDAASGEQLPVDDTIWQETADEEFLLRENTSGANLKASITQTVTLPLFNPYDRLPWLTQQPLQADRNDAILKAINSKKPIRYAAERYEGQMLYAWSVTGYTLWNNNNNEQLYIALAQNEEDDTVRYIPFELLSKLGNFYN